MSIEIPLSEPRKRTSFKECLIRTAQAFPTWAGRHWESSLSLVVITLGAGYLFITHDGGTPTPTPEGRQADPYYPHNGTPPTEYCSEPQLIDLTTRTII